MTDKNVNEPIVIEYELNYLSNNTVCNDIAKSYMDSFIKELIPLVKDVTYLRLKFLGDVVENKMETPTLEREFLTNLRHDKIIIIGNLSDEFKKHVLQRIQVSM